MPIDQMMQELLEANSGAFSNPETLPRGSWAFGFNVLSVIITPSTTGRWMITTDLLRSSHKLGGNTLMTHVKPSFTTAAEEKSIIP